MRILIVGAGGLGGFFGAHLLNASRDVTFLVRPHRAQQLRDHGLQLSSPSGDLTLPAPPTVTASTLHEQFDLILLSCKAYDLDAAINDFAPAVGPGTAILPLLNGMAHMEALDQRFGRPHVLGGATPISATRDEHGRILQLNTLTDLQFGDRDAPDSPHVNRIAEALTVPGFSAHLRPNILQDMWQKWVSIASIAGFTCLMRCTVADFVNAQVAPMYVRVLEECAAIATAQGFPPAQPFLASAIAKFTQPGSLFTTSMLRDLEAGNQIESHQIIGDLIDHARRRALSSPLLEVIHAHLRCYEARRLRELAAPKPPSVPGSSS